MILVCYGKQFCYTEDGVLRGASYGFLWVSDTFCTQEAWEPTRVRRGDHFLD